MLELCYNSRHVTHAVPVFGCTQIELCTAQNIENVVVRTTIFFVFMRFVLPDTATLTKEFTYRNLLEYIYKFTRIHLNLIF